MKTRPAAGWVSATSIADEGLLAELNELRKENDSLRREVSLQRASIKVSTAGLAGLEEEFVVRVRSKLRSHPHWQDSTITLTWRDIFASIGVYLFSRPDDLRVKDQLGGAVARRAGRASFRDQIEDEDFETIKVHLRALGLVEFYCKPGPRASTKLIWSLTPDGERLLLELRAIAASRRNSARPLERGPRGAGRQGLKPTPDDAGETPPGAGTSAIAPQ
jgi:hypothetical protein